MSRRVIVMIKRVDGHMKNALGNVSLLQIFCRESGGELMLNSNIYDYINVLDRAADASYLRNKAIANNMANINTPGYKRQDVSFASNLEKALRHSKFKSLDEKVGSVRLDYLKGAVFTDHQNYSYRLDGNNVDIDTESAHLASNTILYNGLTQSITAEFNNIKLVSK